jgi:uroporphyrinogen decarboxylase
MKLNLRSYKADFTYLLKVLRKEPVDRPVLFEFFMNNEIYSKYSGEVDFQTSGVEYYKAIIDVQYNLGYDYAIVPSWLNTATFTFPAGAVHSQKTFSLNQGFVITDEESFRSYKWPDPDAADYSMYEKVRPFITPDFRLVGTSNDGIFETITKLVGFDNLCFMVI